MAVENQSGSEFQTEFRFHLWHLFYLVAFYAAGLVITPMSWVVTTGWLAVCVIALFQTTRRGGFKFMSWVLLFAVVIGCLLPAVDRLDFSHSTPRRVACRNQTRFIMLAMLNYESSFGHLPPAQVLDSEGRPMHSWRVLLLPFMEYGELYDSYDFSEPWDGPNNRLLQDQMPSIYRCPMNEHKHMTHYKLVVGSDTAFQEGFQVNSESLPDGAANCAAVVEDVEPVNWMQPSDLTIEEVVDLFSGEFGAHQIHEIEMLFEKRIFVGSNIGFLDASVATMDLNNDPDELRKLFGIDNGPSDPDRLGLGGIRTEIKKGARIAAALYICLGLVPIYLLATKSPGPMFIRSFRLISNDDSEV